MMQKRQEQDRTQRSKLLKLFTEKHLHGQRAMKIVEPMKGKTDEEKEQIAQRLIEEVKKM